MRGIAAGALTSCALVAGVIATSGGQQGGSATAGQAMAESAAQTSPVAKPDLGVPKGVSRSSNTIEVAQAWLRQNSRILGTTSTSSMHVTKELTSPAVGQKIIRLQESHSGVPVMGGQAVLAVDASKRVVAAVAKTLQGPVPSTEAKISADKAAAIAVFITEKSNGAGVRATGKPSLQIFDPRIVGGPGLRKARLAWQVDVARGGVNPIKRTVYVDANGGWKIASIDRLEAALNRRVCDANSSAANIPCSLGTPARSEGGAALVGDLDPNTSKSVKARDVNNAYDFAGFTYNLYSDLGRDGIDGNGGRIDSTVRYCPNSSSCPYGNAYWDGSQMVYGTGYASADDVVAHELTHGVTEHTSGLYYYFQSGAINEGLSDVFGEFVDQIDGVGTDNASVKWKIGEDLPGGSIRDMASPTSFGDPDKTSSTYYAKDKYVGDSGGVHTNSGITNKAAFLMTDGGTFNGQTISGIGVTKAARVWYQTQLLLTSGSDYQDLGVALGQACDSITGTASITSSDCEQVDKAALATEMNVTPVNASVPQAEVCTSGVPTNIYANNFDGAPNHTWASSSLVTGSQWRYGSQDTANGLYAKSGQDNLWGDDPDNVSDTVMTMPGTIHVPTGGAFVHFKHAFGFEADTVDPSTGTRAIGYYDGGVVEYSTDSGTTWHDAASLMAANGYTGTIDNAYGADNPLRGRNAFVGASLGYQSTRMNLSSLAGQDVTFRFRIGSDAHVGDAGWFIDDFRAYTCGVPDTTLPQTILAPGGASGYPTSGSTITSTTASFTFNSDESGSTFQCRIDSLDWATCVSPYTAGELGQGPHTFEVRAIDPSNNIDDTPSSMTFSVDSVGPLLTLDSGPNGYLTSTSATFAFSSSESPVTFECQRDSSLWATCNSPQAYTALAQGRHDFAVRAVDSHGNRSAVALRRTFTVDTVKPNTLITTAPSTTRLTRPTFKFTRSPLTDTGPFQCQIDSGAYTVCVSPWQPPTALKKGTHTFRVAAMDWAGNLDATPASKTFRVY